MIPKGDWKKQGQMNWKNNVAIWAPTTKLADEIKTDHFATVKYNESVNPTKLTVMASVCSWWYDKSGRFKCNCKYAI